MKFFKCALKVSLICIAFVACDQNEKPANSSIRKRNDSQEMTLVTPSQEKPEEKKKLLPPEREEDKVVKKDSITDNFNTENYAAIVENEFLSPAQEPLSTFSIDVDGASYSNVRRFIQNGELPPPGAVRIEELINYFDYNYPEPGGDEPFTIQTEVASCPWNAKHNLVHIGLKGKSIPTTNLPASNLVFLVDVSGSMNEPNKLPLVQTSLKMLTDQLREKDRVAIVVYAGNAGLVLQSTPGTDKKRIKEAIDDLEAGGSTAGGEGISLAYKIAKENFIREGNNRVILATDGDFNVGISSEDELVKLIENERKTGIYLSVLGYGVGNYQDDKMQQLADKGNGNHYYIDNSNEAKKVLVKEFASTLFTIAKDVKIQIEFNPKLVQAYRLVGYENRMLASEDFNNDQKDAGEIGSGHTVTALYEVIPPGADSEDFVKSVDALRYQATKSAVVQSLGNELMTIKVRYKSPEGASSRLITKNVSDQHASFEKTSDNFRFTAAVAEFGLLLRHSAFRQESNYDQVESLATNSKSSDPNGYRSEFIDLVRTTEKLDNRAEK